DEAINFGKPEFNTILNFVAEGNDVFISTHGVNIDTLQLKTEELINPNFEKKPIFKLRNKAFKGKEFSFDKPFYNTVFKEVDTLKTTVLGISGYLNKDNIRTAEGVNFIRYTYGKGKFYFHTFPEVFTNYNLLKENNYKHAAQILSYIDEDKPLLWDSYYKTGKSRISSPMHYLLSNKALKWAYYISLIGVLLYVIFGGKRKQRIIPVIKPLKNQTLAFTKTISNMYLEKSSHKEIAQHKINYLFHFIRTKLNVSTNKIDESFIKQIAKKSGKPLVEVKELFGAIKNINTKKRITNQELIHLNKLIENFKHNL
ncbi:MAG TPA: DUF4350 domain-containing protein, partial [Flavobacteriaceae bacterium]|nr:DUF4350 domain-containing protein [Flavobacteriaceae bacterium]